MSAPVPARFRRHADRRTGERPLVLAHRGASAERLENTLPAFRRARELGADGVELDVLRCASGEVLVFHDDDLARLAGRPGALRALPLSALREVRLVDGGAAIPTLDEAIEEIGPDLLVNVELKAPERRGVALLGSLVDDGLAAAVAALVRRFPRRDRFLVSSFDPILLGRFRAAAPEVATGLLVHHESARPLREAWAAPFVASLAVHPEDALVTPRAVAEWHRRGYAVHVWTVDDPREIAWLAALGVDAVITNRPDLARAVLDGAAPPDAAARSA